MRNILSAILIVLVFLVSSPISAKSFNPQQVQQIQQIIHDYLVNNPEILVEASHSLQQKQFDSAMHKVQSAIPNNFQQLFKDNGRPTAGNPKAKIILVEFFDYQCPHCRAMENVVEQLLKDNQDLKVIFVEWPIFGNNSQYAAQAAIAAAQQDKYYPFHDALLDKGDPLDKDRVLKLASSVGIDLKQLQKDMQDNAIDEQLKANFELAQNLNIVPPLGTPAFFIGNLDNKKFQFVPGQVGQATLQQAIDAVK